jgi:serine/threonine kinase PknH
MSINSEPTMPGYLWAQRPVRVDAWAPSPLPQPWTATAPRSGNPANSWAAARPPAAPAWHHPMPPRTASPRHRWLPVGMAVSVAVLAAAAGLVATLVAHASQKTTTAVVDIPATASGPSIPAAPTTPPPPPLVRDEALPALLLDAAAVNAVMGTGDLAVNPTLTTARLYIDTTDKPECGGVWANANKGVYAGSAWQAVQTQYLREPDNPQHEVYQSVVSFPIAATAREFVAKEAKHWPVCAGTALTTTIPTIPAQTWWIATVSQDGDVLTSVSNREGAGGYTCQHALTSRNNVVIDTEACGWDVTQQGSTIAHRIAEQISRTL